GAAPAPAEPDGGGLALEERLTPPPLPTARLAPEPGDHLPPSLASEGFTMGADPNTFDAYDFGASGPALALATEPDAGPQEAPAASPHPAPAEPPAEAAPEPPPVAGAVASAQASGAAAAPAPAAVPAAIRPFTAPLAVPTAAAEIATGPVPARRESRLRAAAVNAVALLALLVVTLAFLVVWRSDGGAERLSLRPGAILAALGRGGPERPFTAVEVRSGVYEREKGLPILFVRGKVISHAAAPVRTVRVRVEVVRSDAVLARGEALAGAVPTPEELYRAGDDDGVAALAKAAAARAPRQIHPGDAVPFLVPITDAPADLEGASVRVELASGAAASP
ncbi:MAG TPA: thioredoxin, partial [Anaeromyxobacter sp.]|nr:thioredoxin [Anaeromyxobacter sp.]